MAYVPFSLRYRPQTFEEIVGQDHVSRTLQNAVATGRVVHAYLFAGPRGTGKTSTARVLAKALLCEKGPTPQPCGECEICQAIAQGRCLDVIEIDAASNRGIEQIRELREKVRYSPAQARYKIYILDEVHMLTPEAFNALLKTLEEPPEHTFFVLATTELHRVPPTIVSRCQLFEFHLIPEPKIKEALRAIAEREGVEVDDAALEEVARAAHGALRDAESIFDQVVAYADGPITADVVRDVLGVTPREAVAALMKAMAAGDLPAMLGELDELVASGKDLAQLLYDVTLAARDMLRMALGARASGEWAELEESARALGSDKIADGLRLLGEAEKRLRDAVQQQVTLELALVEVTETWSREGGREFARAAAEAARKRAPRSRQAPTGAARAAETSRKPPDESKTPETGAAEAPEPPAEATEEPAPPQPAAQPAATRPAARSTPPQREAEPAEAKPAATAEELAERWQEVHHQLKRMRRVALWGMLRTGRPVAIEGDVVVIRFDPQWKLHCDMVSKQYREDVEQALSAVLRRQVTIRCVLGDVEAGGEQADAGEAPSRPAAKPKRLLVDEAAGEPTAAEPAASAEAKPARPQASEAVGDEEHKDEAPAGKSAEDKRQAEGAAAERASEQTKDAVDRAAELTLDIFPESEEIEPE